MNRVQADIQEIIQKKMLFTSLTNSKIMVTGATGLIGSMLIKTLIAATNQYKLNIEIIGQIRDIKKARLIYGEIFDKINFVFTPNVDCDYIIHTVSPTSSKFFIEHPVETIKTSVGSLIEVLESAKNNGATVVYLSSMEQYGIPYELNQKMSEEKIGIIDHLNIRSSYSESKRLCECMCVSYAAEYNMHVKIARLAQTFGAGVSLSDSRMPMQFAKAVIAGEDIILHTEGKSISNIVYLTDAITGILTILTKGTDGQAYNICNDKETRSVREIAELVCNEIAKKKIMVKVRKKDNMGYAPDVTLHLDSSKLNALGWNAEINLVEAYQRLLSYLRNESI